MQSRARLTHRRKLGCDEDCCVDDWEAADWAPLDGAGAAMAMKLPSWAMVLRRGRRHSGLFGGEKRGLPRCSGARGALAVMGGLF